MPRACLATVLVLFLGAATAGAQDVLTVGDAVAASGGTVQLPLWLRDRSGTALGSDAAAGNRIQGTSFKILFPIEHVASISMTRAGVAAQFTPLFETTLQGSGFTSGVMSFDDVLPFALDTPAPGNRIGTLTVTLTPQAIAGTTITLVLEPAAAMLSNQTASVRETVAAGNLSLDNGTILVSDVVAPSNLVATASGTSQVNLTWGAVGGADLYEVWRSVGGAAFSSLGTTPGPSFTDFAVSSGTTYLYHVQTLAGGNRSPFSNVDAATTIVFTDDPLVPNATFVQALHLTQLRTAVNAMRAAAALGPLAADPTIAAGQLVMAQHILTARTGLTQARSAIGLPALSLTDPALASGTAIKAAHVQELRTGVK